MYKSTHLLNLLFEVGPATTDGGFILCEEFIKAGKAGMEAGVLIELIKAGKVGLEFIKAGLPPVTELIKAELLTDLIKAELLTELIKAELLTELIKAELLIKVGLLTELGELVLAIPGKYKQLVRKSP